MYLAQRKRRFGQTGYWCSLELSGLGGVVFCGFFLVLFIFMMLFVTPRSFQGGPSLDYVVAPHAIAMPKALREDAIVVAVMRDGSVFLQKGEYSGFYRVERVRSSKQLSSSIIEMVRSGSEGRVYIKADKLSKYGAVVQVIDAVNDSGLEQIVFLTEVDR